MAYCQFHSPIVSLSKAVNVIALEGEANPVLYKDFTHQFFKIGMVKPIIEYFRKYDVKNIIFAGGVNRRFSLSYRDLEEMMSIRGAKIDHSTLQRWVIRFVPLIDPAIPNMS